MHPIRSVALRRAPVLVLAWMLFYGQDQARAAPLDVCPQPLRVAVLSLDPFGHGFTKLLLDSTDALLAAADVKRQITPMPFVRIALELEAGRADVITVSTAAVEAQRSQLVSIQFLRMPVLLYEYNGPDEAQAGGRPIGIMRGAPIPPALSAQTGDLHPVTSYATLFQMLAAHRLRAVVGARPTADLYLQDHPEVAALVRPGAQVDERRMSIHLSRRLPKPCLAHLVERIQSRGPALTRKLFETQYKSLNYEDYRVPVQVIEP